MYNATSRRFLACAGPLLALLFFCACCDGTEEAAFAIDTDEWRETVFALVSSAENSTTDVEGQYGYIEDIGDGRGYTAGLIGFTSGTGDLLEVVERYVALKPENNGLAAYLPALRKVNGSDSHEGLDPGFSAAWESAAVDEEMKAAQMAEIEELYLNSALEAAAKDGLGPLGAYIYYDALVMHGPGRDSDSFGGIRKRARKAARPPAKGGDETAYLEAFLAQRAAVMAKEEAHADLSRIEAQRKFLSEGNLRLNPPLTWTMYGDEFTLE